MKNDLPGANNRFLSTNNGFLSANNRFLSANNRFLSADNGFLSAHNRFLSANNTFLSANNTFLSARNGFLSARGNSPGLSRPFPGGSGGSPMPLTTIGSYLLVTQEFINHWEQVNLALGGAPATDLKLSGGYTRADLITDRQALQTAITGIEAVDNARQITGAERDLAKAALRPRISQFRVAVQHSLPGTGYARALPRVPNPGVNETAFLQPFDDVANLWGQINAEENFPDLTPPLLLLGGYALAELTQDLIALRQKYIAARNAEENARLARKNRDLLLPPLRNRMKQYRSAVLVRFGPDHALTQTLPAITPPPGSTPDPVSVSGSWDAAQGKAVLTWTASPNPALDSYSVRTAPGPTYRGEDESVVAQVPAGTTTYATSAGLAAPGATALFRVYVVLTTGNERGSATVKVTRP